MGWNGTALPPSALHMDSFLFLYPTIGWADKRIPGMKPFLRAQPKLLFSAKKKREKIPRKVCGRQSDNFLLPQLPVCQERRLLLHGVDGRIHKMRGKRWEATQIPSIFMKIPTGAPKPGESWPRDELLEQTQEWGTALLGVFHGWGIQEVSLLLNAA